MAAALNLATLPVLAETAQEAWNQLVGAKPVRNEAFRFVENDPALPNVLIYGDSISIGYTSAVRKQLKQRANVYRLHCNGGDSSSFIRKFERLQTVMRDPQIDGHWTFQWDVIHFNVGLHDLKFVSPGGRLDKANGTRVTPPVDYRKQLGEIVSCLETDAPNARLVFALTTPVPENEPGRFVGEAAHYNHIAIDVLKDHPEVVINDLYTPSKPYLKQGNVHYQGTGGIEVQGAKVAEVISRELSRPGKTVAEPETADENPFIQPSLRNAAWQTMNQPQ
jgi:hypothetical protein